MPRIFLSHAKVPPICLSLKRVLVLMGNVVSLVGLNTLNQQRKVCFLATMVEFGHPKTGTVADIMSRTRALYHYAV